MKRIAITVAVLIALATIGRSLFVIQAERRRRVVRKASIAQEIEIIALCGVVLVSAVVWPWSAVAGTMLSLACFAVIYYCHRTFRRNS